MRDTQQSYQPIEDGMQNFRYTERSLNYRRQIAVNQLLHLQRDQYCQSIIECHTSLMIRVFLNCDAYGEKDGLLAYQNHRTRGDIARQ